MSDVPSDKMKLYEQHWWTPVHSEIRNLPDEYIVFHVEVRTEKRKLVNAGRVRLCFFDAKTKRVIPAPEMLLAQLRPHFGV